MQNNDFRFEDRSSAPREDVCDFFADRIKKTDMHALGLGTSEISRKLGAIVSEARSDYSQRRRAEMLADMLIEFAEREEIR